MTTSANSARVVGPCRQRREADSTHTAWAVRMFRAVRRRRVARRALPVAATHPGTPPGSTHRTPRARRAGCHTSHTSTSESKPASALGCGTPLDGNCDRMYRVDEKGSYHCLRRPGALPEDLPGQPRGQLEAPRTARSSTRTCNAPDIRSLGALSRLGRLRRGRRYRSAQVRRTCQSVPVRCSRALTSRLRPTTRHPSISAPSRPTRPTTGSTAQSSST